MSIQIEKSIRDAEALVAVTGEVDVSNAAQLRAALEEVADAGASRTTVDLAQVSYIDSTGIGVLVGATNRAAEAGRSLVVANPQRNVARVFSMLGVDKELGIATA